MSSDLQQRIDQLTEELVAAKTRAERRDLNVAINQLRQQQWAQQRDEHHSERLRRREENRTRWAADRQAGFEAVAKAKSPEFDQFTIDSAKRLGMTPQEFLDLQEKRRAEMRGANPGNLPNGGLG